MILSPGKEAKNLELGWQPSSVSLLQCVQQGSQGARKGPLWDIGARSKGGSHSGKQHVPRVPLGTVWGETTPSQNYMCARDFYLSFSSMNLFFIVTVV